MDLDYRALSNAGLWCIGRLQTDADRERVMDGLALTEEEVPGGLDTILQRLAPRWFVVRDAHQASLPVLLHPRQTLTLMRGPMTRAEIRKGREWRATTGSQGQPAEPSPPPRRSEAAWA